MQLLEPRGCSRAGRKWAGLKPAGPREVGQRSPGTGLYARGAATHSMWRGNSVSHTVVCAVHVLWGRLACIP
eukprot:869491-Prymnesium_polylepis.1